MLTYHKIDSNLSNVFYSMQASRTDFYAHQFKPVYKFIESLDGRILIADEVGLGKTIEAGLIWLETKARRADARRLLIVCPPMLREKWKKELRTRFDTRAEIYDSRGDENVFYPTAAVDLKSSSIAEGTYLLAVQFWTFEGLQKKVQIEYALSSLETGDSESTSIAESILQEIMQYETNWEYAGQMINHEKLMTSWGTCLKELNKRYKQAFEEFLQESNELKLRCRQHLEGFSLRKQDQAAKEIKTLQAKLYWVSEVERTKIESQVKGNETKISNLKANLEKSLAEVEQKNRIQKDFKEIAAVVCRVKNN